jgi:hypothetical protein
MSHRALGQQFGGLHEPRPNPNFDQPYEGTIGKYLYHHTSPRNRASIGREGLVPKDPKRSSAKGMSEEDTGPTPTGVYLGPHEHIGGHALHGRDVWAVDTNKVNLRSDPGDHDNYWGFHLSERTIPPEAMKLIHKGKRQPPKSRRS